MTMLLTTLYTASPAVNTTRQITKNRQRDISILPIEGLILPRSAEAAKRDRITHPGRPMLARCQSLGYRIGIAKGLYNQGLELQISYEIQRLLRLFRTQLLAPTQN
ncbi:hypothetical protein PspS34_10065 [Pseudomonas sp. S34]|nr:hypothetical protein PspS34_10065 [Pseudomonas sp. S34]